MNIEELTQKAVETNALYADYENKKSFKKWSVEETYEGLVSDVGDLGRLVLTKEGYREMPDLEKSLEHELAEILYTILLISHHYSVDLTGAFLEEVTRLEKKLS